MPAASPGPVRYPVGCAASAKTRALRLLLHRGRPSRSGTSYRRPSRWTVSSQRER